VGNSFVYAKQNDNTTAINYAKSISNIKIPSQYGKITHVSNGDDDKIIAINIQDLHAAVQTQKKIAKIIDEISKQYPIKQIFVEGAYDKVDVSWLRKIEPIDLKKSIIKSLINSGKLSHAELYALKNKGYFLLSGLEDELKHKENIKRLENIFAKQEFYKEVLERIKNQIYGLAIKHGSKENLEFTKQLNKYADEKISTEKWYEYLNREVDRINLMPLKYANLPKIEKNYYPNIQKYISYASKFNKINSKKFLYKSESQLQKLMLELRHLIPAKEYFGFMQATNKFSDGYEMAKWLDNTCKKFNIDLKENYKELYIFLNVQISQYDLDIVRLLFEERRLSRMIRLACSSGESDIELAFLADFYQYLKSYLKIELMSWDYKYFCENINKFREIYSKYVQVDNVTLLEDDIKLLNRYYELNIERTYIFSKKIFDYLDKTDSYDTQGINAKKEAIIIITGGYHSFDLSQILTSKKITNITITPSLSENSDFHQKYKDIILSQSKFLKEALSFIIASELPEKYALFMLENAVVYLRSVGYNLPTINLIVSSINNSIGIEAVKILEFKPQCTTIKFLYGNEMTLQNKNGKVCLQKSMAYDAAVTKEFTNNKIISSKHLKFYDFFKNFHLFSDDIFVKPKQIGAGIKISEIEHMGIGAVDSNSLKLELPFFAGFFKGKSFTNDLKASMVAIFESFHFFKILSGTKLEKDRFLDSHHVDKSTKSIMLVGLNKVLHKTLQPLVDRLSHKDIVKTSAKFAEVLESMFTQKTLEELTAKNTEKIEEWLNNVFESIEFNIKKYFSIDTAEVLFKSFKENYYAHKEWNIAHSEAKLENEIKKSPKKISKDASRAVLKMLKMIKIRAIGTEANDSSGFLYVGRKNFFTCSNAVSVDEWIALRNYLLDYDKTLEPDETYEDRVKKNVEIILKNVGYSIDDTAAVDEFCRYLRLFSKKNTGVLPTAVYTNGSLQKTLDNIVAKIADSNQTKFYREKYISERVDETSRSYKAKVANFFSGLFGFWKYMPHDGYDESLQVLKGLGLPEKLIKSLSYIFYLVGGLVLLYFAGSSFKEFVEKLKQKIWLALPELLEFLALLAMTAAMVIFFLPLVGITVPVAVTVEAVIIEVGEFILACSNMVIVVVNVLNVSYAIRLCSKIEQEEIENSNVSDQIKNRYKNFLKIDTRFDYIKAVCMIVFQLLMFSGAIIGCTWVHIVGGIGTIAVLIIEIIADGIKKDKSIPIAEAKIPVDNGAYHDDKKAKQNVKKFIMGKILNAYTSDGYKMKENDLKYQLTQSDNAAKNIYQRIVYQDEVLAGLDVENFFEEMSDNLKLKNKEKFTEKPLVVKWMNKLQPAISVLFTVLSIILLPITAVGFWVSIVVYLAVSILTDLLINDGNQKLAEIFKTFSVVVAPMFFFVITLIPLTYAAALYIFIVSLILIGMVLSEYILATVMPSYFRKISENDRYDNIKIDSKLKILDIFLNLKFGIQNPQVSTAMVLKILDKMCKFDIKFKNTLKKDKNLSVLCRYFENFEPDNRKMLQIWLERYGEHFLNTALKHISKSQNILISNLLKKERSVEVTLFAIPAKTIENLEKMKSERGFKNLQGLKSIDENGFLVPVYITSSFPANFRNFRFERVATINRISVWVGITKKGEIVVVADGMSYDETIRYVYKNKNVKDKIRLLIAESQERFDHKIKDFFTNWVKLDNRESDDMNYDSDCNINISERYFKNVVESDVSGEALAKFSQSLNILKKSDLENQRIIFNLCSNGKTNITDIKQICSLAKRNGAKSSLIIDQKSIENNDRLVQKELKKLLKYMHIFVEIEPDIPDEVLMQYKKLGFAGIVNKQHQLYWFDNPDIAITLENLNDNIQFIESFLKNSDGLGVLSISELENSFNNPHNFFQEISILEMSVLSRIVQNAPILSVVSDTSTDRTKISKSNIVLATMKFDIRAFAGVENEECLESIKKMITDGKYTKDALANALKLDSISPILIYLDSLKNDEELISVFIKEIAKRALSIISLGKAENESTIAYGKMTSGRIADDAVFVSV
jgi:hypothetical protein